MTLDQFQRHYPKLFSELQQRFANSAESAEMRRRRITQSAKRRARRQRQLRRRIAALEQKVFST